MVASGAFTEDDNLELIEGWVVQKTAKGPAHEYVTGQLEEALRARVPTGHHVRNQAPITLSRSEPEPDLTVVRGERSAFRDRHPGAGEVVLVVEVSDSTLMTDRFKGRTYGAAGLTQYWIVNVAEGCIEVYTTPAPDDERGYASCAVLTESDNVTLVIDGAECAPIPIAELLP